MRPGSVLLLQVLPPPPTLMQRIQARLNALAYALVMRGALFVFGAYVGMVLAT